MSKKQSLIIFIAVVILLVIILFPLDSSKNQTIIRQDQEIRSQDNVDEDQAVKAIEENLGE